MAAISNGWFSNTISQSRIDRVTKAVQDSRITGTTGDALKMGPVDRVIDYVFCGHVKHKYINCLYQLMKYQTMIEERRMFNDHVPLGLANEIQSKREILGSLMRGAKLKIISSSIEDIQAVIEPDTHGSGMPAGLDSIPALRSRIGWERQVRGASSGAQQVPAQEFIGAKKSISTEPVLNGQAQPSNLSVQEQVQRALQDLHRIDELDELDELDGVFSLPPMFPETVQGQVRTDEEVGLQAEWSKLANVVENTVQAFTNFWPKELLQEKYELSLKLGKLADNPAPIEGQDVVLLEITSKAIDLVRKKEEWIRKADELKRIYLELFVLARDSGSLEMRSLLKERIVSFTLLLTDFNTLDQNINFDRFNVVNTENLINSEKHFLLNFNNQYMLRCITLLNSTPSVIEDDLTRLSCIGRARYLLQSMLKNPGGSPNVRHIIENLEFSQLEFQSVQEKLNELLKRISVLVEKIRSQYKVPFGTHIIRCTSQTSARIREIQEIRSKLFWADKVISMERLMLYERVIKEHGDVIHEEYSHIENPPLGAFLLPTESRMEKLPAAPKVEAFPGYYQQLDAALRAEHFRRTGNWEIRSFHSV